MQCVNACASKQNADMSITSPPYLKSKDESAVKTKKDDKMAGHTRYQSSQQKSMLMGSIQDMEKNGDFVNAEEFLKADSDTRLLALITSLNKLHNRFDNLEADISGEKGFCARLEKVEIDLAEVNEKSVGAANDVQILKGIVHKQENQIASLTGQVVDLQARLMSENLVIVGIIEFNTDEEITAGPPPPLKYEDPKVSAGKALTFIRDILGLEIGDSDIYTAYRMGEPDKLRKWDRKMLVKCHPKLKEDIMVVKKDKLRDYTNEKGKPVYINIQEPESFVAQRKEVSHGIKKVKEMNRNKDQNAKSKFQVKKRKLFVDQKEVLKSVPVPSVFDCFPKEDEQEKMDKVKFWCSDPLTEQGNVFTAFVVKASNVAEASRAYRRLRQLNPTATHISMAYDCQKKTGKPRRR